MDVVAVPRQHPQGVGRVRQRHIFDQFGQFTVEDDVGQIGPQRITDFALDLVDIVDQRLQGAVLDDPFGGGLLAHPGGDAGQVIARVAAQRGEVGGVLGGREPVLGLDGVRSEAGQLADTLTG